MFIVELTTIHVYFTNIKVYFVYMIIYPSGQKYRWIQQQNSLKNQPYDFRKNGLLKRYMSPKLFEGAMVNNIITFVEVYIFTITDYIDYLKNFKDISNKR